MLGSCSGTVGHGSSDISASCRRSPAGTTEPTRGTVPFGLDGDQSYAVRITSSAGAIVAREGWCLSTLSVGVSAVGCVPTSCFILSHLLRLATFRVKEPRGNKV